MSIPSQFDVPLASLTTLKVGGPARELVVIERESDVMVALNPGGGSVRPFRVLGGGSNLLVSDAGVSELVLKMEIRGIRYEEAGEHTLVSVGAGESFDGIVAKTVEQGLWGLENLSHIPGSVGATPIQNVGAYGVEVADRIESLRVYDTVKKDFVTLTASECQFGYRYSLFKQIPGRYVVTEVTFRLSRTPQPRLQYRDLAERFSDTTSPTLAEIRSAIIEIRAGKFPNWHEVGTAGSFFKNPIVANDQANSLKTMYPDFPMYPVGETHHKLALGWLLDKVLHLKGYSEGVVGTYEGQALVLVAYQGASAADVSMFAERIMEQVHEAIGVYIEWEVTRW